MKIVHGNTVFIREETKQARNTHRYAFQLETSLELRIKQTIKYLFT